MTKSSVKELPRRVPQGPVQLCNENQETIFNTDLSRAADDYTKAVKETKLWKEKLQKSKRELCRCMKEAKLVQMTMGQDKVIKYKYTEAKEDIVLSDYKAKSPSRNRYRR